MVANTFLSAPLMFISAKMIAASSPDSNANHKLLNAYEFNVSVLSTIGGVSIQIRYLSSHNRNLNQVVDNFT